MKIISKEKSNLINRTEVMAELSHVGKPTPPAKEIIKILCKDLNSSEELVVIRKIGTNFGEGTSIIKAYVYDNIEELKKLEKYEKKKNDKEGKEEE